MKRTDKPNRDLPPRDELAERRARRQAERLSRQGPPRDRRATYEESGEFWPGIADPRPADGDGRTPA